MIKTIVSLQMQIFDQTGQRTDAHYQEGYGVLFVPENYPLHPRNVIMAVEEFHLQMMSF